jgi:hypothetical protein
VITADGLPVVPALATADFWFILNRILLVNRFAESSLHRCEAEIELDLGLSRRLYHASPGRLDNLTIQDFHKYTRTWIAWANTLFGELILTLFSHRRNLLA